MSRFKSFRYLIPLFVFVFIFASIFFITPSANAAVLEAPLYEEEISVFGEQSEITYRLGSTNMEVRLWDASDGYRLVYMETGRTHHYLPLVPGHRYRITISPFGFRAPSNGLLASSLPNEFVMRCGFGFVYDTEDTGYATIVEPSAYAYWYSETELLSTQQLLMNDQNGRTVVTTDRNIFDKPDNANCFSLEFQFNNISFESDPVPTYIYVEDFTMKVAVSSLDLLQNFYQWTRGNSEVYNQLVSAVGGLEGILGGNAPGINPPDSDVIFESDELENGLSVWVEDNFDSFISLISGLGSIIFEIGPAMLFITWFLDLFVSIGFIGKMLNVCMSLGIAAFVLNLVVSFISKSRDRGGDG